MKHCKSSFLYLQKNLLQATELGKRDMRGLWQDVTENINLLQEVTSILFLIHWSLFSQLHVESQDSMAEELTITKDRVEQRMT